MTLAMQRVVLWYLFGLSVVVVYGLFRVREIGGLWLAIRSPRLLRGLGLLTLAVLAAPVVVLLLGVILLSLYIWVTGTDIR